MANPLDCPALHQRSDGYPFGDRVPHTVRMLKTVMADPMPVLGWAMCKGGVAPLAMISQVLPAWTNSHGAVAVILADGQMLGVKPDEFEVAEWHPAPIDFSALLVEVDAARRRFIVSSPVDPKAIVFPEGRRGQPVTWHATFPKQERRTDPLGTGRPIILGMEVRFSPDAREAFCLAR